MVTGAQTMGFNAAVLSVFDEPAAIAALSNQTPFVAMIDLASLSPQGLMFQWHFVVPLALVQDEVLFHDPADGPDRRVMPDDLLSDVRMTAGYRVSGIWTWRIAFAIICWTISVT